MKSHLLIKFFWKLLIIILISFTFVYVFQLITLNAASVNSGSFAVDYTIVNDWGGGATVNVKITNNGANVNDWSISWSFAGNQKITNMWNAKYKQTENLIVVTNTDWNGKLPTNSSETFGFNISYSGQNLVPTDFKVNSESTTISTTISTTSSVKTTTNITPSNSILTSSLETTTNNDNTKILIPHKSWTCGMADGIPAPESGEHIFDIDLKIEEINNLGKTQYGMRKVFLIQSGTVSGSKLNASILKGGLDFQLDNSNSSMEIEQLLIIKTSDNKYIYLRNAGIAANQNDVRIVLDFEAPNSSSYSWLNSGKYLGRRTIDQAAKTMKISIYDVSKVNIAINSTNTIKIDKPENIPYQQWDYRTASSNEKKGSQFIIEDVSLGSSISVGSSKRGNRNIIPITGGNVTGNINAKILYAGADYQLLSSPTTIDARYLWQTNDGEIIIVRNGGAFGSLVPTFEVSSDSKYSYLNNKLYLSSDPAMGSGGVNITFYESN